MDLEQLRALIKKYPLIAYPAIGLGALVVWSLLMLLKPQETKPTKSYDKNFNNKEIGLSVGGVDKQAYLARLEKNYYDFEDRAKSVEQQVNGMKAMVVELKNQQKEMANTVLKLDEKLVNKIDERLSEFQQTNLGNGIAVNQPYELSIANIKPINQENNNSVYLPLGSFCKGTLLTGVYAAADVNNPLPVLIALEEAFYGPNKTRIPLKGAFVLGKAYGDLVSERALIQIVAISSVLPNGHTFEHEENLGYVTDAFGELGIRGQVIRNTGRQLALSFMGGFAAGGSQAVADGEVTTSDTRFGGESRRVTGDAAKHAVFSGLAKSAGRMADYYEKQAEDLVPAVHIQNGNTVYFIVQKGVNIDGLPRTDYAHATHIN